MDVFVLNKISKLKFTHVYLWIKNCMVVTIIMIYYYAFIKHDRVISRNLKMAVHES